MTTTDRPRHARCVRSSLRFHSATLATLLSATTLCSVAAAQAPAATSLTSTRTVNFSNRTALTRSGEYGVVTIPFNEGEYFGAQDLVANGAILTTRPFGRHYSDGSYRFAEAIVPVDVPAAVGAAPGTVSYTLSTTTDFGPAPNFNFGPNTTKLGTLSAPLSSLQMHLDINGTQFTCDLQQPAGSANGPESITEHGPRHTRRYIGRAGDYVYTLYVYQFDDEDYMNWELRVTNSGYWDGAPGTSGATGTQDYTSTDHDILLSTWMNCDIGIYGERGHEALGVGGFPGTAYASQQRMGRRASLSSTQSSFVFDTNSMTQGYVLSTSGDDWGDGQSQVWRGQLVVPDWNFSTFSATYDADEAGHMAHPLIGMCQEWQNTTAFGPQGYIAPGTVSSATVDAKFAGFASWLDLSATGATVDLWDRFVQGPNQNDYIGLLKFNGSTGAQPDFGILEGWDAFASGDPRLAEQYGYLGYHSTRRSVHRYYGPETATSGAIVHATEAAHPDPNQIALYGSDTFSSVSQTFFFKNKTTTSTHGRLPDAGNPHDTNGWNGWKISHMSINHLYTAYVLNPWSETLAEELDFHKEAWVFQNPDPDNNYQTWLNHYGEARSVGRSYFAMAQIANARGLHDYSPNSLLERLNARTDNAILRRSTPGTTKSGGQWPVKPRMWGPFFGTQYVASIVDASTGSYTLYEEDPANAGQTIAMQSPATIAPWEEQMAPYGLYACYKMTLEDGQSTNYGDNHMIAAMALAGPMLRHCTVWSASSNPLSSYAYPGTTVSGPLQNTPPGTPAYLQIAFRYAWRPDANGYGIAATASEVQNYWYMAMPTSNFPLWVSPSVYLLQSGAIPIYGGATVGEASAFVNFVSGTNYDQRWRWGQ